MQLRKVDPRRVVDCTVKAIHSGVPLTVREIESHILAGGRPEQVVTALMLAKQKGMPRSFSSFAAADLVGLDVVALVLEGREPVDAIGARQTK